MVPIPKANKATYTHPRSWRSIHLLSVVSKTLKRIVLLRLQQDDTLPSNTSNATSPPPMGPTQFGSCISLGTSDAMRTYLRWRENVQAHDHFVTLISADVEGGFDKVDPRQLHLTDLNPLYTPWIRHWAANRSLQFRHNARLDPTKFTTNSGIPQGSPLSPFLFGAYIKKRTDTKFITTPDSSRIIISYVDDVLICVSSSLRSALERQAKETWETLTTNAASIGMTFAENKTRTLHDRTETWGIGTSVDTVRFLGYWIETRPTRRSPPSYDRHIDHWTTKANYSFNTLRALFLRSDKGLRSSAILKIQDVCTRSILLDGLEFWGSDASLIRKADAFIYAAVRALFDLPIATPHRALSSEFSIRATSVRYNLITRRIAARSLTFDPLRWLDALLPNGPTRDRLRLSLDSMLGDTLVSWHNVLTTNIFKNVFSCIDVPGDEFILNNFQEGDLIVCTDGSFNGDRLGYSFCIFDKKECLDLVMDYHEILTPRKTILDAEATALVCGLDAALALPHTSSIYLLSDCRSALRIFLQTSSSGPLSYLDTTLSKLARSPREIFPAWIKGHAGHPGNERADSLAKSATLLKDPFPGTRNSYLALHLTTATSTEWLAWFARVTHEYTRTPTHHTKLHRGLTRLESSVLFRLRSNKGWSPGDQISTQTPPPYPCDNRTPRDGTHLLTCPTTSRLRPPDATSWVHLDKHRDSILK